MKIYLKAKYYFKKLPHEPDVPFWERVLGRLLGDVLLWLGKRQADRKDWHEYNHTLISLLAGDSTSCRGRCAVPTNRPIRVDEANPVVSRERA